MRKEREKTLIHTVHFSYAIIYSPIWFIRYTYIIFHIYINVLIYII